MRNQGEMSVRIKKLKDGNFATWKFQMKHYFTSKGCFGIVNGSESQPKGSAESKETEASQKRSEYAFSTPVLAVSSGMIYLISD